MGSELAASNVIPFKKAKVSKTRYPDPFPPEKGHFKLITEQPFPASVFIKDRADIFFRLKDKAGADMPLTAIRILGELCFLARALGRLEIKIFVNPCSKSLGKPSLLEILLIEDSRTFAVNFEKVGITYPSWTQYHTTPGDRFNNKAVLRVLGRGGRATTFRLNQPCLKTLAEKMALSSSIVDGKQIKSKTILLPMEVKTCCS